MRLGYPALARFFDLWSEGDLVVQHSYSRPFVLSKNLHSVPCIVAQLAPAAWARPYGRLVFPLQGVLILVGNLFRLSCLNGAGVRALELFRDSNLLEFSENESPAGMWERVEAGNIAVFRAQSSDGRSIATFYYVVPAWAETRSFTCIGPVGILEFVPHLSSSWPR